MAAKQISILLADDHKIFREMCRSVLSRVPFFTVIGEAEDGLIGIETARTLRPDVVLMDIQMKIITGFEACRQIRKCVPGAKVIMLSMYNLPAYVKKMKEHGGSGYLTKNTSIEELTEAIVTVASGKSYVTSLIEPYTEEITATIQNQSKDQLTKREVEIVSLVKNGFTSKQIAQTLFVSPSTVEMHRYNIFKKLKVANIAALIQYAFENGL